MDTLGLREAGTAQRNARSLEKKEAGYFAVTRPTGGFELSLATKSAAGSIQRYKGDVLEEPARQHLSHLFCAANITDAAPQHKPCFVNFSRQDAIKSSSFPRTPWMHGLKKPLRPEKIAALARHRRRRLVTAGRDNIRMRLAAHRSEPAVQGAV